MFQDFKKFVMRGNVIDLAVGVIIGGAFGKIVSSLVNEVIMPVISLISGQVNLSGLHVRIGGTDAAPINISYGNFIQASIDFLIVAAVIFVMVRAVNKLQKPEPAKPAQLTKDQELLTEIRDNLRSGRK